MKSPSLMVSDVSDRLREAKVTRNEFVAVNVSFSGESDVQLVLEGFVRAFKMFKITRARLVVHMDNNQNAHMSFTHKGLQWVSILRSEKIAEFYRLMAESNEAQTIGIGNTMRVLPAPLKRLGVKS